MIHEYKATSPRRGRGISIEAGQTLYAIAKGNLFFAWSYSDRNFAEQMDMKLSGPIDSADRETNWRDDWAKCVPSDRKGF